MTTETSSVETDTSDLVAKHLAFKENAVQVAHDYASKAGHCATFDQTLHEIGLPGRNSYYAALGCGSVDCTDPGHDVGRPVLTGEATVEEFDAWKYKVACRLYHAALRHGIYDTDQVMSSAGFPTEAEIQKISERVNVKIEGQFALTTEVEVVQGVNLIEFVSDADVLLLVRNVFYTDAVTWKVTIADPVEVD